MRGKISEDLFAAIGAVASFESYARELIRDIPGDHSIDSTDLDFTWEWETEHARKSNSLVQGW